MAVTRAENGENGNPIQMALSNFFLDAVTLHGAFVYGTHNHWLVLLSVFVSMLSTTMALQTANIARRTENPRYRNIAVSTGALALVGVSGRSTSSVCWL